MKKVASFIDVFYPPFRRLMPLQTFRYAACGGSNTLLGLAVFYVSFHFIFEKENFDAGFMVFTPYTAALFLSGFVTFTVGFLLNKYVVFVDSYLRGRIQLFRYFLSFFFNLIINYGLLKLFVEILELKPFLAQVIATVVIITISYLTQKHFSFRETKRI